MNFTCPDTVDYLLTGHESEPEGLLLLLNLLLLGVQPVPQGTALPPLLFQLTLQALQLILVLLLYRATGTGFQSIR